MSPGFWGSDALAFAADSHFLVVARVFKLFTRTIEVDCEVGVVMSAFDFVGSKPNTEYQQSP